MNFSFCLIARNEAKTLPKLLASLDGYKAAGGEVCLLDTGSIDDTVSIAHAWGCIVEEAGDKYRHTIDEQMSGDINGTFVVDGEREVVTPADTYFDFGSARNHAASLATNDMVSFVDADEVLVTLDYTAIEQYINDGFDQFEYSFVFAHDPNGRPAVEFTQSKFYNRTKMRWNGIIHEVLSGEGNRKFLSKTEFGLEHFQNVETNRGGYLRGLAVDCFNNPLSDRNSHYFAREMMWTGRPKSAIKEFERHVAMNKWDAERAQSLIFMGDCYGQLGLGTKQSLCYFEAFDVCPRKRESLLKLAHFYRAKNNPQATAAYAEAALTVPWSGFYADQKADYEHVPHELLYWAYGWIGNIPKAQEHINHALWFQPYNENYLRDTQFYFEYKQPGILGWMRWPELLFLYGCGKKYKNILELGSWKGRSTHALLSGGAEVTAVDTWLGSEDIRDDTNHLAKKEDVFATFMNNVGNFKNLKFFRAKGHEAAQEIPDASYDMIFIDAGHTYEDVKQDIADWLPKVKKGGILCGHDYVQSWMGVIQAVDEAFGKPDELHDTIWVHYVS